MASSLVPLHWPVYKVREASNSPRSPFGYSSFDSPGASRYIPVANWKQALKSENQIASSLRTDDSTAEKAASVISPPRQILQQTFEGRRELELAGQKVREADRDQKALKRALEAEKEVLAQVADRETAPPSLAKQQKKPRTIFSPGSTPYLLKKVKI